MVDEISDELMSDFAEICGIHAGDGWMSSYNYEVGYGTSKIERQYFDYVNGLYSKVFNFKRFRILERLGKFNTIELRIASRNIQNILLSVGFHRGPKLDKLRIPDFIKNNSEFAKRFIRGLLDTDGTVYWRKSLNNYYLILQWTCTTKELAYELKVLLEKLNYSPQIYSSKADETRREAWKITLQKINEVSRFLKEIGIKNLNKYSKILLQPKYLNRYMGPPGIEPGASTV
ncbi:MAG: LAGLIDADG family homing endonuclease [Candidatus Aenigmatarchaeota archaeon]